MAGGIGNDSKIPWNLKTDKIFFMKMTQEQFIQHQTTVEEKCNEKKYINALIMGRKTFDSFNGKPLPNRRNIVITRQNLSSINENLVFVNSFTAALQYCNVESNYIGNIFFIGGATLMEEALAHPLCRFFYLTKIFKLFPSDTFIKPISNAEFKSLNCYLPNIFINDFGVGTCYESIFEENGVKFTFLKYEKKVKIHEEQQYLSMIKDIINNGVYKIDRTKVGK